MSGELLERLAGKRVVHLDSMGFIYFVEAHQKYVGLLRPLFASIDDRSLDCCTSYLTLLEVMVQPLRRKRSDLARSYRDRLVGSRGLKLFPVDRRIAEAGAEIRASYAFKTPDAIQLATAQSGSAEVFITNDHELKKYDRMEILVLDDLLEEPKGNT
jgi:predicted nucleic acid-binding protein